MYAVPGGESIERSNTMFGNILVPLDGSSRAELAIPVAARLAQVSGGTVVLLRVVYTPDDYIAYQTLEPIMMQKSLGVELEEARNYLDKLTHLDDLAGVHTKTDVFTGDAAATILSTVDEYHSDLIVMSSHGYTGMKHWIMGSIAEKVAQHAPVPVLVLREGKPLFADHRPAEKASLRALVPLDGSARAETAIAPAAHLVAALSAPGKGALHLTQVIIMPDRGTVSQNEQEALLQQASQNLQSSVEEIRDGFMADYEAELKLAITWSVTIDDDIAAGIVRVAETGDGAEGASGLEGYDIIAMATHGYSGLQRWALGSTSERVLHATRLPLLIVRPPDVIIREQRASTRPTTDTIRQPAYKS